MSDMGLPDIKNEVTIPKMVEVSLPSRGLLYGDKIPAGLTSVTPMDTDDEEMLMGAKQEADRLAIINNILLRHLDTKGLSVEDLLVGDRVYALFIIRNISFGPDYQFTVRCDSCAETFTHILKVPEGLRIRVLNSEDANEPICTVLPVSGKKIGLKHLRGKDETAVRTYVRDVRAMAGAHGEVVKGDPSYLYRIARAICQIDGKDCDINGALGLLKGPNRLTSTDSISIQNKLEEMSCGISLKLKVFCPECAGLNEMMMPFTTEFFRPTRISLK